MSQQPTQKVKAIQVPLDLLGAVKEFHIEREAISHESMRVQQEAQAAQLRLQQQLAVAETKIASAIYDLKLLPKGAPFGLDTRYVEELDLAFIRTNDDDGTDPMPDAVRRKLN